MGQRRTIINQEFAYIASPYSKSSAEKREQRYLAVCAVCAFFVQRGETVYSPIAHWHPIAKAFNLPIDMDFWRKHDLTMLQFASRMIIACIDGWQESDGIEEEVEFCSLAPVTPITYFDVENLHV
jgi:hypothetical protein